MYTLFSGVNGHLNVSVSHKVFPSLAALFELEELSDVKFSQSLKAGGLSDLVVICPGYELSSSPLMDESVLNDTKIALSARS